MRDLSSETMGTYHLGALVGEGPQAQVYAASRSVNDESDQTFALKVFRDEVVATPGFAERLRERSDAIKALNHTYIAPIIEVLSDNDTHAIVMQLSEAGSLRELNELPDGGREPLALPLAIDLIRQAAEGLAHAHTAELLHLNLKPTNLLIVPASDDTIAPLGYKVMLSDFCIFNPAELEREAAERIAPDTRIYTLPPEHYRSARQPLDARSDIYALGTILYEAITGEPPFDSPLRGDAIAMHLYESPRPPSELRPDLPEELEAIMVRCLAKQPDERFASAAELVEALKTQFAALVSLADDLDTPPAEIAPPLPTPQVRVFAGQLHHGDYDLLSDGLRVGQRDEGENQIVLPRLAPQQFVIDWDSYQATVTNLDPINVVRVGGIPLAAGTSRVWGWNESLRTGAYLFRLLKPDHLPELPPPEQPLIEAVADPQIVPPSSGLTDRVTITPQPATLTITPGKEAKLVLEIENRSLLVEGLRLTVEGDWLKPEWVRGLEEPLYFGESNRIRHEVTLNVPAIPELPAGSYTATFAAQSEIDQGAQSADVTCIIQPFAAPILDVRPKRRRAVFRAHYTVYLRNGGNTPETYKLSGEDDPQLLDCDLLEPQVRLKAGQVKPIRMVVRPRQRIWYGDPEPHTFEIRSHALSKADPQPLSVILEQRPIIPRWLVWGLGILLVTIIAWNYLNAAPRQSSPNVDQALMGFALYGILNPTVTFTASTTPTPATPSPSMTLTPSVTNTPTVDPSLIAALVTQPALTQLPALPTFPPTTTPIATITPTIDLTAIVLTATTQTPTLATATVTPTSVLAAASSSLFENCDRDSIRPIIGRGGTPGAAVELYFDGRRVDLGVRGDPNEKVRVAPNGEVSMLLTIGGQEAEGLHPIRISQEDGRVLAEMFCRLEALPTPAP